MKTKDHAAQTALWRGSFGDAYVDRNVATRQRIAATTRLWSEILKVIVGAEPNSILEVGSNVGINLRALRAIIEADFYAVEPNATARSILIRDHVLPETNLRDGVAQKIDFQDGVADLVFTSGVLIHIHPDDLLAACGEIYRCARRYIVCIEYFSSQPEMIPYRGHEETLFRRDFGGFWLDNFPGIRTLGYGFAWKRASAPDDLTWWIFEKPAP